MIILENATYDCIKVSLDGNVSANQLHCFASWHEVVKLVKKSLCSNGAAFTNNTTEVVLVAAPPHPTMRSVRLINIYNADTATQVVTMKVVKDGVDYLLRKASIEKGETMFYVDGSGWGITQK